MVRVMSEKKETNGARIVAVHAVAIAAFLTALGTISTATKKAAVYLSLPERLDRVETRQEAMSTRQASMNAKLDTIIKAVQK